MKALNRDAIQPAPAPVPSRRPAPPPAAFRPVPFWSWNERMTPAEVARQCDLFARGGWGGGLRPQPRRPDHAVPGRRVVRRLRRHARRLRRAGPEGLALRRGQVAQRLRRRQRAAGRRAVPDARAASPAARATSRPRTPKPGRREGARRPPGLRVGRPRRQPVVQRHLLRRPDEPGRRAAVPRRRLRAVRRPLRHALRQARDRPVHRRAGKHLPHRPAPRGRAVQRRTCARPLPGAVRRRPDCRGCTCCSPTRPTPRLFRWRYFFVVNDLFESAFSHADRHLVPRPRHRPDRPLHGRGRLVRPAALGREDHGELPPPGHPRRRPPRPPDRERGR